MKDLNEIRQIDIINSENIVSSPTIKDHNEPRHKTHDASVDFYKKLCLKLYISPNPILIQTLKQETFGICLDQFTLKEINLINKIIGKFHIFKQIIMSTSDTNSKIKFDIRRIKERWKTTKK